MVATTGAINRAKLQSNHHHRQTNIQFTDSEITLVSKQDSTVLYLAVLVEAHSNAKGPVWSPGAVLSTVVCLTNSEYCHSHCYSTAANCNCCCCCISIASRRHVHSASRHHASVPRHRLSTFGRRAFSVAGPTVWNTLSDSLRDPALSSSNFRQLLTTDFFDHYSALCALYKYTTDIDISMTTHMADCDLTAVRVLSRGGSCCLMPGCCCCCFCISCRLVFSDCSTVNRSC